jgi:hypothetical protein
VWGVRGGGEGRGCSAELQTTAAGGVHGVAWALQAGLATATVCCRVLSAELVR